MSDLDIAQKSNMQRITDLANHQYGIPNQHLQSYGHYKAKLSLNYIDQLQSAKDGKLILITALSPTPMGEGKTTTVIGLGDAMNKLGNKTLICLREPSLGPCFGVKGGAAGGGYAQIVPMEDINLHFTGDFHAIGAANNLLAAMLDNHIFQGKLPEIAQNSITWNRAMDMNDRALRNIRIGTNGPNQNYVRESGFDITAASEVMAIFCLATSLKDLKTRLGNIIVGYTVENHQPIFARDLNAHGAMTALLKDALQPNLVQTLENNIALIHGGPFANIAHGCNSVIATKTALKLADYVVAEAGFGADLGAEKFINIKCRKTGLQPAAIILVATVRSIKYHGGIDANNLNVENIDALVKGFANLDQHIFNIRNHYGLPCIVCINHFKHDSDKEIKLLIDHIDTLNCQTFVSRHWANGSDGAIDLAKAVIDLVDNKPGQHQYVYQDSETIWQKIESVATKIYGASSISASKEIRDKIDGMDKLYGDYPICIAKTQMSFSTNPNLRGAPKGHNIEISNVRVSNGAGFIVVIAGNVLTMPGLPKIPAAENIDVDEQGQITGLF